MWSCDRACWVIIAFLVNGWSLWWWRVPVALVLLGYLFVCARLIEDVWKTKHEQWTHQSYRITLPLVRITWVTLRVNGMYADIDLDSTGNTRIAQAFSLVGPMFVLKSSNCNWLTHHSLDGEHCSEYFIFIELHWIQGCSMDSGAGDKSMRWQVNGSHGHYANLFGTLIRSSP